MNKILIVEDDRKLAALTAEFLQQHAFDVSTLARGDAVLPWLDKHAVDLVILDLMLPGRDGFEVCKDIRRQHDLPILMLTARGDSIDQIIGLENGADDYVVKPVEPRLLLARVKALLRRNHKESREQRDLITLGALQIRRSTRTALLAGREMTLTSSEFELLWLLCERAGEVVSRDEILLHLRGIDFDGFDRSADVIISRLRRKLGEQQDHPHRIKTVWAKGYQLTAAGDA
ncbi:response regulator transcription factor [Chitinilyticum piscinae]|uniref:Response regulator transcription factor n=1 Tax=Chitinilyticum piscinae TaxID=2866724 RepID=A0A8J7FI30_9NEIS|nr:response regulator transcription factor [Chitinilyticum piscinae]MBE9608177.1 response regulator transcription factor [Chitinilyticum piscinae]